MPTLLSCEIPRRADLTTLNHIDLHARSHDRVPVADGGQHNAFGGKRPIHERAPECNLCLFVHLCTSVVCGSRAGLLRRIQLEEETRERVLLAGAPFPVSRRRLVEYEQRRALRNGRSRPAISGRSVSPAAWVRSTKTTRKPSVFSGACGVALHEAWLRMTESGR